MAPEYDPLEAFDPFLRARGTVRTEIVGTMTSDHIKVHTVLVLVCDVG